MSVLKNSANSIWNLYWNILCLILKLFLPMPIGTVCAVLILLRIVIARAARSSLMHSFSTANASAGLSKGGIRATGGVSRNTMAMLLLSAIYFFISLPNIALYILVYLASASCAMQFVGLLAANLMTSVASLTLLTRIFDGIAFLVVPEFRASLLNILHCSFLLKSRLT